ncbi:hypothetical protein PSHT_09268, partial [Puccinia striiformis]
CIKQTITTPDGEAIPGSWVHPSTRRRHWAQNSTPQDNHRIPPVSALPSIPPPNETSPASEPDSEPAKTLSEAKIIINLVCGVSQANCRIARDWIIFIIKIFQKLPRDRTKYLESYKDSRTITKHLGLDPEIESSICCPKCFSLYEHEDAPTICAYRRSKKAQVCGEGLFKKNADKLLPGYQPATLSTSFQAIHSCLVYHTQPFNSWLKWFLNVPGIEDEIFTWREKVKSTTDTRIVDIQQSKAWRSFQFRTDREPARNELRLTFSVFIDWLNPFSNKLAGRQVSMGVIALTCLDLSPQSRNKHNNIFIAVAFTEHRHLCEHSSVSCGRKLSVHLGVLIGDMVATHKIAGFASHAATLFCSWCQCLKKDMMHMQLDDWEDDKSSDSQTSLHFQDNALAHIQKALPDIIIPRGVTQVPLNLGDPKHGKLKASEWHSLFSTYLPLSLINFFVDNPAKCATDNNQNLLLNFSSLVICTNIVSLKLNSQAPRWSLEIDNNECDNKCDNESQAKPSRLVQVHPDIYMAILQKLQSEDPTLRHYQDLPHPDGSRVVTPYANEEDTFKSTSGLYISKTKPKPVGCVSEGWPHSLTDFNNRILVAVKALADACTGDAINIGQSFLQTLNDLELKVVQENPNRELLDPGQVIAVCAYRHLPAWTFRYHLPLVVLRQMPHDLSHLLFPSSTQ